MTNPKITKRYQRTAVEILKQFMFTEDMDDFCSYGERRTDNE